MAQAEAKNAFDGIRPVSEAVAAKPGALDEGNLGAKTCGDTGGDEPGGATADDHKVHGR